MKPYTLILLGILAIFLAGVTALGYWVTYQPKLPTQTKYCKSEGRVLSDQELLDKAVEKYLSHLQATQQEQQNLYTDLADFYHKNPNCCRITGGTTSTSNQGVASVGNSRDGVGLKSPEGSLGSPDYKVRGYFYLEPRQPHGKVRRVSTTSDECGGIITLYYGGRIIERKK